MLPEFRTEPFTDFRREENRRAFLAALAQVEAGVGKEYPLIIGGQRVFTGDALASINPCNTGQVVGKVARAGTQQAEQALQAALQAFETWSATDPVARARLLAKAAQVMRRRKHELSAAMVLEVGKSWAEADADTAEAIDFLEYYSRQVVRLACPAPLVPFPGEDNEQSFIPLGVGVVIPPWNFPLAILTGMTVGAVVAGNTVILKPASTAPVIGAHFMEVMEEAGLPPGVINFLPGPGSQVGDYLVDHPKTRFVAFTGSREVGIRIYERAAKVQPGQIWLKRVIAEMGGKDAIVVDRDADVADAVQGIVSSAFGFQGQKCSACSRAIVVQERYDEVLTKVVEATRQLVLGEAKDPATQVAAVADAAQYEKIKQYIEIGKREGRLMCGGETFAGPAPGYYIEPTIFADVAPGARLSQEEIFGPVLAFTPARDFEDAIRLANGTEYGLTGAVYSRNRAHIEYARRAFHVGNLYINRKCTGAIVGVHPFGGFNMSGTDAKAGGPEYLLFFLQAKAVSEKL